VLPKKRLEDFRNSCVFSTKKQSEIYKIYDDMINSVGVCLIFLVLCRDLLIRFSFLYSSNKGVRNHVKDHKQFFKTYPKTINGEDLMKFLLSSGIAKVDVLPLIS